MNTPCFLIKQSSASDDPAFQFTCKQLITSLSPSLISGFRMLLAHPEAAVSPTLYIGNGALDKMLLGTSGKQSMFDWLIWVVIVDLNWATPVKKKMRTFWPWRAWNLSCTSQWHLCCIQSWHRMNLWLSGFKNKPQSYRFTQKRPRERKRIDFTMPYILGCCFLHLRMKGCPFLELRGRLK